MSIVAVVQARTSSSRLPGKVLMEINHDAMILYQLKRIIKSKKIDKLVLATSSDSSDDNANPMASIFCINSMYVNVPGPIPKNSFSILFSKAIETQKDLFFSTIIYSIIWRNTNMKTSSLTPNNVLFMMWLISSMPFFMIQ